MFCALLQHLVGSICCAFRGLATQNAAVAHLMVAALLFGFLGLVERGFEFGFEHFALLIAEPVFVFGDPEGFFAADFLGAEDAVCDVWVVFEFIFADFRGGVDGDGACVGVSAGHFLGGPAGAFEEFVVFVVGEFFEDGFPVFDYVLELGFNGLFDFEVFGVNGGGM